MHSARLLVFLCKTYMKSTERFTNVFIFSVEIRHSLDKPKVICYLPDIKKCIKNLKFIKLQKSWLMVSRSRGKNKDKKVNCAV